MSDMLTLYTLHDDQHGNLHWEEMTYLAVWAHTPDEARAIYLRRLPSLTEYDAEAIAALVPVCKPAEWRGDEFQPSESGPHEERRCEVLRSLGWLYEDESRCEVCDLAPFGIPEYSVCRNCYLCRGCREATQAEPCEECEECQESEAAP